MECGNSELAGQENTSSLEIEAKNSHVPIVVAVLSPLLGKGQTHKRWMFVIWQFYTR